MGRGRRASFVVRTVQDARGEVSGVIERVATGAKEAFTGVQAIGPVIARMLEGEGARLPDAASPSPEGGSSEAALQGGAVEVSNASENREGA